MTGFVGLYPVGAGGVAWDYLQYVAGLVDLGWDAMYVEDTGLWPVYQHGDVECTANVAYLASTMRHFGMADRWAYRDAVSGRWYGKSETALRDFCRSSQIFLNVSCSAPPRDEYAAIPIRAVVDTDPMFTQLQYLSDRSVSGGGTSVRATIDDHTHRFTFGGNVGQTDCLIPTLGLEWHPTRQPVVLRMWPPSEPPHGPCSYYSTVMNWRVSEGLEFAGRRWGQKDIEFLRIVHLPRRVPDIPLAMAVGQLGDDAFPADAIQRAGWKVFDANACTRDAVDYQSFIRNSRGEFSVAKQTYVEGRTGWFSCRSACYLAAGRPVVTQDTAWSRLIPSARGLLPFHDAESAADALRAVAADPRAHAKAARAVAAEWFDSRLVLGDMLAHLGATGTACASSS